MSANVSFVDRAPGTQINIQNGRHRGGQSPYKCIGNGLLAVLHLAGKVRDHGPQVGAPSATFGDRVIVLERDVFASFAFEQLVNIGDDRGMFVDDENIRPEIENFLSDIAVDPTDEGEYGNHGADADHYAQQSQRRAQLIRPQRSQCDSNGFGDVHGSGLGR